MYRLILLATSYLVLSCSSPPQQPPPALSFSPVEGLESFRHTNGGFGEFWMPEIMGSGGGLIDIDGDGWLDVLLVGGGHLPSRPIKEVPALHVYKNLGTTESGTLAFRDVTAQTGLANIRAYGFGLSAADYDNDGDPDILLTTLQRNLFFENENGTFKERSAEAGLDDIQAWSTSAVFFDANRDGHLDLYITNYLQWSHDQDVPCAPTGKRDYCNPLNYPGLVDSYYQNNGDGTFTNRTSEAGFNFLRGKGLGITELDYNNDGWPDLYVANDGQANFLFRNNQDGTFAEVGVESGVAFDQNGTTRAGMGVDAGVVDSTGQVSIFVGNFSEEMVGVWRNDSSTLFTDRAAVSKIGFPSLPTLTFGLSLVDLDLDTDLDLMLVNGHVITYISEQQADVSFKQAPQLFFNQGNGSFDLATFTKGPMQEMMVGRGLAVGDVDRDGDLDLLVTENNGPARLWQNNTSGNAFLHVSLEGTESNRDALGARIRAHIPGLTLERRIRTGSSYLSQSEQGATFGLGPHTIVSELEVLWPSGRVDRFDQVAVNQRLHLREGSAELRATQSLSYSIPNEYETGTITFDYSHADSLSNLFKDQLQADSSNARTHFMYGQLLEQMGSYDDALHHYQKAWALNPDNPNYTLVLGALLFRRGALQEALPYLEQAVGALPSFYPAQYTMGQLLLALGQSEQAQNHLARADTARALFQQITQLERAAQRIPNQGLYHIRLGELYYQAGMYDRSEQAFEAAKSLDPLDIDAYFGLGKTAMEQGKHVSAVMQLDRVVRARPAQIEAWLLLGLAYVETGNCNEARAAWRQALSRDPTNPRANNYINSHCQSDN